MNSTVTRLVLALGLFSIGCGDSSGDGAGDTGRDEPEPVACESTSECGEGGVCRDGNCDFPISCSEQSDCGTNRECDTERSICVECLVGDDCAVNEACLGHVCRQECESEADCPGAQECSANGHCAECLDDGGCADDEYCHQGACAADLCQGRSTTCTDDGNVLACSERGDSQVEFSCPDNESCGTEQGPAWCQGWICVPSTTTCSEDGATAETCSSDGLTIAATTDCAGNNSVCVEDGCEAIICDAYSSYCKDGDVYECNEHGTVESLSRGCFLDEYCDAGTAACRPRVCAPETVGCDGGQVATCDELGSSWEGHQACDVNEACDGGACEPIVCEINERFCDAGNVQRCNSLGTGSSLYDACSGGEYCSENGAVAVCSPDVCTAGQLACDGDVLGTCRADGSGIEAAGTTDCAGSGQVCHAAECKDVICTESERLCVAGDVHLCVDQGSATSTYDSCDVDEYCDELTATCQNQICTPSAPGCDGEVGRVCNADGSDWELGGTDCASQTNKACDAGVCEDVICSPGGRYCDGTQIMTCNGIGTGGSLYQSCTVSRHCYESSPTYAYCRTDICTADQPVCDGEVATTCSADGGERLPGGTDCELTGDACWEGSCEPPVCTPGPRLCAGGDHHNCINNGTATSLRESCEADEYCDDVFGCEPQVCTPDADICNGALVTTCESDGSGPVAGGTDCSVGGQVCHAATCLDEVCVDGEYTCDGKELKLCKNNGTLDETQVVCGATEYCSVDILGCNNQVCAPNVAVCLDATSRALCRPDGSSFNATTYCSGAERCDAGACVHPGSLCSVLGKTWGTPVEISDGSYPFSIQSDATGNIFVFYARPGVSTQAVVQRYSSLNDTWSARLALGGVVRPWADTDLAVAPDGTALAAWADEDGYWDMLEGRVYDPSTDSWGDPTNIRSMFTGGTGYRFGSVDVRSNPAGDFVVATTHNFNNGSSSSLMGTTFSVANGWGTPAILGGGLSLTSSPQAQIARDGTALVGWFQGGDVNVSFFDPGTGTWGASEVAATTASESVASAFRSPDGTSAIFLSGYLDSHPFSAAWTESGGYESKNLFPASPYSTGLLHVAPNGDTHAFINTEVGRLPSGSTAWEFPDHSAAGATRAISYSSDQVVALNAAGLHSYDPGAGWAPLAGPDQIPIDITALSGCRMAAVFEDANKTWVSIYE